MISFLRILSATAILSLMPAAFAHADDLSVCRAKSEENERLRCYDQLADAKLRSSGETAVHQEIVPSGVGPAARVNNASIGEVRADAPGEPTVSGSLLGKAWELDPGLRGHTLRIRQYQPVYLLPLFHASRPNNHPSTSAAGHAVSESLGLDSSEAKLQISLKSKIAEDLFGHNGDLWFGYTQSSRWQVYNGDQSRPFRETNYEPELMFVWRTDYDLLGWSGRLVNLGVNHQSNGRSQPLSRSWNRIMLSTSLERDNWTMTLRPWWRIAESTNRDDNPDIADYMGRADLQLVRTAGEHQFSLLLRHSLRGGDRSHGAVQMDYAFPISGDLRGHVQWFSGYGESLIDYNHRSNYIGIGLSLLEWY